jgi:hypothetical protein
MSDFADKVQDVLAQADVPKEWQARFVTTGNEGEIVTGLMRPVSNDTELLKEFGYNPDEIEIVGTINQWRKQMPDGEWRVSYYFKHRARNNNWDLPALYAAAKRKPKDKAPTTPNPRTTVVALSDVQIGKTGSRGGTPELIERIIDKRTKLDAHLRKVKPDSLVLAEAGDLFEGFESGGNPMFTNDLSLAQQIDMAVTEVYEFVSLMCKYGHVDVMCVPSNHTAWRMGKQNLGNPQDDLGLLAHRQVEKVAKAAGLDATWHYPAPYDEAVILKVRSTTLGMVHGNQYNYGNASQWWAKQQHGGQPIGAADVLIAGHYHVLNIVPTGRNPYSGRSKWFIQAPTLDNGSDWFRNRAGDDSDPGLLVFDVTDNGFDLQSLTVL